MEYYLASLPPQQHMTDTTIPTIMLKSGLLLDLEGGILLRGQEEILLSAREMKILHILVRMMQISRSYLSAKVIAQQIGLSNPYDPEHCIEQNISELRRKFGEVPHRPCILKGRRGLGYRLFPESTTK